MLKKRTLALLLSLTLLLTFMPMLTYAEAEEDADKQITETVVESEEPAEEAAPEVTEEAAEAELAEEAVPEVAEETIEAEPEMEAAAAAVPEKAVMTTAEDLWGFAGDDGVQNWYLEGNSFVVTYSDNTKKTLKFVSDDEEDAYGYYEDGNTKNGEFNIWCEVPDYKLKEGKNTVNICVEINNDTKSIGTVEVTGKKSERIVSAKYQQVKPISAEYKNGWVDYWPENDGYSIFAGDKVTVTCYEIYESWDCDDDGNDIYLGDVKNGPFTYTYECKKDEDGYYSFFREFTEEDGEVIHEYLDIKFWDDQYWDDSAQSGTWKAGTTQNLTASIEGVDVSGKIVINVKPNAAHKHTIKKVKKVAATCQKTGVKAHYECTGCGELFKDKAGKKKTTVEALTIKKTAHKYKNKKVTTDEFLKTPATCTQKGVYYYCAECKMCHEQTKAKKTYKVGSLKPHEFTKIDKVEATCEHAGMKEHYKCSLCNKLYASQTAKKATTAKKLTIKKLKHKYTAKVVEDKYKAKKAGMYYYSCSMCGAKGKKTFKVELQPN